MIRRVRQVLRRGPYHPHFTDVVRTTICWARGHWFDGQFCGRCGWFLP